MRIDIFTIFPQMFESPLSSGIFKRASERHMLEIYIHNIRDYTHDKHNTVDDYPYGGGPGMVFKPDPVFEAVESVKKQVYPDSIPDVPVILLTPQGSILSQQIAGELSRQNHLMLICGHYEGVDERIMEHLATKSISIGDYVLSGGELPAMVLSDAVIRLIPGVLGSGLSPLDDSHSAGLLEYPQYTRPENFRGWIVPEVLLSGNHAEIARWRQEQSIIRTLKWRPDLIEKADLTLKEKDFIQQLQQSQEMV